VELFGFDYKSSLAIMLFDPDGPNSAQSLPLIGVPGKALRTRS
jgi:hypothetical protein